jgi:thioredoxin 1
MLKLFLFTCGGCETCERQREVVQKARQQGAQARAEFREVDTTQGTNAAEHYRVRDHPTTLLEKDGKEIKRWVGVTDLEEVVTSLLEHAEAPRSREVASGPALPPPPAAPGPMEPPPGHVDPPGPEPMQPGSGFP